MDEWTNRLKRGQGGKPVPCFFNVCLIIESVPSWHGVLRFDEFALKTMCSAPPPWEPPSAHIDFVTRTWTPHDDLMACAWLQEHHNVIVNFNVVDSAVEMIAKQHAYHPVLDFLDGMIWDGVERLSTWMAEYLGADGSDYTSAVARKFLIGAVARIRDPGCQCDSFPILEGMQGAGKSSTMRRLFEPWFSDELADLGGKDAAMQVAGTWCIEISELDALSRPEASKIKAFISRRIDRFRPPYGRRVIEHPRASVFCATTNCGSYLKDETGARRVWPIRCGTIKLDGLLAVRDQLFAEADVAYRKGESWWLNDDQVRFAAEEQQADRYVGDAWSDAVLEYMALCKHEATVAEILVEAVAIGIDRQDQVSQNRIARILVANGYERCQRRVPVKPGSSETRRQWFYRKREVQLDVVTTKAAI